jgi:lantibiotic modifying enzyme
LAARVSWRPVADGALASRCLETAREIARALAESPCGEPSLARGEAGISLLHAYLHFHEPEAGHDEHAIVALDRAIESLSDGKNLSLDLYGGLVGVAWVSEHLQGRLLERGAEDPNADVDEILASELEGPAPGRAWDLVAGFVGHGVYALERLRHQAGAPMLVRLLALIEACAEQRPTGLAWRCPPQLLDDETRAAYPTGVLDLGVAHGAAGVIALLAAALRARVDPDRARALLDAAMGWTLAQRLPGTARSSFSRYEGEPTPTRLAWCRGDLGMSIALLSAARATAHAGWAEQALDVARRTTARRSPTDAGVFDACLCHGSAGLAHQYARLWNATGEVAFADAARRWAEEALNLRQPGAGYSLDGQKPDAGVLLGAAGVALGLLSVASPVEPAWDACIMTALPTQGATTQA